MFLLDKVFIIFIAREHDRQEERNTIRSQHRMVRVSWHLSVRSSTLIQGKLASNKDQNLYILLLDDSITKIPLKKKALVRRTLSCS